MTNRLTKQQAYSTGNNNDIIDYWLWEGGIDPNTLTDEQYNNVRMGLARLVYEEWERQQKSLVDSE